MVQAEFALEDDSNLMSAIAKASQLGTLCQKIDFKQANGIPIAAADVGQENTKAFLETFEWVASLPTPSKL